MRDSAGKRVSLAIANWQSRIFFPVTLQPFRLRKESEP